MTTQAEWTILMFLNAKNNLEPFAFPNFEQIASIGSTNEVQFAVEFGRPKGHYTNDFGAWTKTLRFHVTKGMKPVEASAAEDLGTTDMGDAKTLIDFVTWGRKKFPSKRTMLIIWNHGQGWRRPTDNAKPVAAPSAVRYVSNDEDTGNQLYNRAIQDELAKLLKGDKLDVIAFDACLMAMVETAYALRDVSKVLVGSQEVEPGNGWDYTSWLEPLVKAKGDVDAAALGKLLVKGMEATYGDNDDTTLSATDLGRAADLGKAISRFADVATKQLSPATIDAFKQARNSVSNYAPGYNLHSIDLGHFMDQIAKSTVDQHVGAAAGEVQIALRAAMIQNYASKSRQGKFGSQGLSIYFPKSAAAHAGDYDGEAYAKGASVPYPVEFVEKEKWAAFLDAYWKLVP